MKRAEQKLLIVQSKYYKVKMASLSFLTVMLEQAGSLLGKFTFLNLTCEHAPSATIMHETTGKLMAML